MAGVGGQVHAGGRLPGRDRAGDDQVAYGCHPGEEEAAIEDREMGGDDRVAGPQQAPVGGQRAGVGVGVEDAGLFEDVAAVAGDALGEGAQPPYRVELGLAGEPGVDRSSGTGTGQSFQGTAGSAWHARSTGFCQPVLLIYPPDVNFNNPGWRYCPGTPPQTRG